MPVLKDSSHQMPAGRTPLIDRVFRRLGQQDHLDRFKKVLLVAISLRKILSGRFQAGRRYLQYLGLLAAPSSAGSSSEFEQALYFETLEDANHKTYLRSSVRLVQHLTASPDDPLCDIGCARGQFLCALESAGYLECEGYDISEFAVKNAVHPRVRHIRSLTEIRRTYRTTTLISVLEHIPLDNLDSFLAEVADLTKEFIAACIPIYPANMLDFFDNDPTHLILERREWWDAAFARHDFVPLPVPTEPLPFIMPFLYRRQS